MNVKNFFLLFSLLLVQGLSANNPTETFHMPRIVFTEAIVCNLPPPSELNVDNVGTDWVDVSWPAVPGADQYELRAFDGFTGDGLGAGSIFVPGTATSASVSTVGNNGSVVVKIWSVCENGDPSDDYTASPLVDTIIIELVGNGFTPLNVPQLGCQVGYTQTNCNSFTWNQTETPFCVLFTRPGMETRRSFSLTVKDNDPGNIDYVEVHPEDLTEPKLFFTKNAEGSILEIRMGTISGPVVQKLTVSHATANGSGPGYLLLSGESNPFVKIHKLVEGPQQIKAPNSNGTSAANNNNERSQTQDGALRLSVKPNPFNEHITVQLPVSNNQIGTNVHLYDLLGALKQTNTVAADQHELNLNTADLTPGVYFLKIESGNDIQTIKVVKTQ